MEEENSAYKTPEHVLKNGLQNKHKENYIWLQMTSKTRNTKRDILGYNGWPEVSSHVKINTINSDTRTSNIDGQFQIGGFAKKKGKGPQKLTMKRCYE